MRNNTIICIVIAIFLSISFLNAKPNETTLDANLMSTQNSYSDNWTGGETGSISWVFNVNYLQKRVLTPIWHNQTTVKLSYGQTHNQDSETKNWATPIKSTDLIDLETVFKLTLGIFVDPFVSGRIETQFLDGSDPLKERTFNPATFTESIGAAKLLVETDMHEWSARVGFGLRQTFNREVLIDPLTDTREDQTTNDGGLEFVSELKSSFAENLTYKSKLILFQSLYNSKADELEGLVNEEYWKDIDVNWEHILSANITKYVDVNLYIQLLYDKEIDLGGRLKQTLSMGLTYKFHN